MFAQKSKSRRKVCKSNKVRTFTLKPTTVMKQNDLLFRSSE